MAGFDPGNVVLRLLVREARLVAAEVRCNRPEATRLLRGKPAEEAVALVPVIYSLCGKAQGIAARAALAAARGRPAETHIDGEAWAEAVREHAWKLFVDWPKQLGRTPDEAFFVRLMRSPPAQRVELASELAAHPLPEKLSASLGEGAIAQWLAQRMLARRSELADWLSGRAGALGSVRAECLAPGIGEARVETARGTLRHRLVLDGERIADYVIVAPTDSHFAADGEAAQWLKQLRGLPHTEARRQALLLVLALDPCVPWEIV